jgi:hypothetical protein
MQYRNFQEAIVFPTIASATLGLIAFIENLQDVQENEPNNIVHFEKMDG